MQPYYELAYALASESLCFFVGTGFSKHLTNDKAPDWLSLLKTCCSSLSEGHLLVQELFSENKPLLPLEECAAVISLQMRKEGKDIYAVIADIVSQLKAHPTKVSCIKAFADKHPSLKFITTNYDLLIERDVLAGNYTMFCPGFPVNRQRRNHEVYHIHGSSKQPQSMVVTADDYYSFINSPNYFSRRLDTLLEENTTIIIGYSLGDLNFKSILNSHRQTSSHSINRQHLFFLSRQKVAQHVKDYYDSSYGLRVIEETTIDDLISKISAKFDQIAADVKEAREQLIRVHSKKKCYSDSFLKKRESFAKILATIATTGFRIDADRVIEILKDTIQRKHTFTSENCAWEQYDQLADWLVQLGCVMDLEGTALEEAYLEAVRTSFKTMSKEQALGKSWAAYRRWSTDWGQLTFKNREMIRKFMIKTGDIGDFKTFIST